MVLPRTPCHTVKDLPRRVFDATLDMLSGRYPLAIFLLFDQNWSGTGRPGYYRPTWRSAVGGYQRWHHSGSGMYSVLLPEGEEQAGSRRVGNWMRRWYMSRG